LNLLEGYYYVQYFSDSEKITFALHKSLPHVRAWWEGYLERYTADESTPFRREPTWVTFVDALKEEFYPIGNYDDQYMRWTTLVQKSDQMIPKYTNIFHTLRSKLGIKDSERHLVFKYHSGLHRYIQTEMDFLDISSLGVGYQYAVKLNKNSSNRVSWSSGLEIRHNKIMEKETLTHRTKDRARKANLKRDSPRHRHIRVT
jgi:hypothetical protein